MLNSPSKTSKHQNVMQETPEFGKKSSRICSIIDLKNNASDSHQGE